MLPPAVAVWWIMRRQHDQLRGWSRSIAPHLLPHLLLNASAINTRFKPLHLVGLLWLVGIFAVAGPSWQRETSPFAEEQSVLVILLKVTPSMLAGDVQPSRLRRAVDKIGKLLARRPDTRTALVAYAGSAHRVMPFTRDHALITEFAGELGPEVMPKTGEVLVDAVMLGNQLIRDGARPGSMLLLADSVDPAQFNELKETKSGRSPIELWAIAAGPDVIPAPGAPTAPALDESQMKAAAATLGGGLVVISVDDSDIDTLDRRISRNLADVSRVDGERWRDAGYFLVPLLVLLALFWFRRGWVVRWTD